MYRMRGNSGYGGDGIALLIGLAVLLLIGVFFLLGRAVHLVLRAFRQQPTNKALWGSLGLCVLGWVVLAVVATEGPVLLPSAAVAGATMALALVAGVLTLSLLAIARMVEVSGQQLFSRPKEKLTSAVLHGSSWWPPLNEPA